MFGCFFSLGLAPDTFSSLWILLDAVQLYGFKKVVLQRWPSWEHDSGFSPGMDDGLVGRLFFFCRLAALALAWLWLCFLGGTEQTSARPKHYPQCFAGTAYLAWWA